LARRDKYGVPGTLCSTVTIVNPPAATEGTNNNATPASGEGAAESSRNSAPTGEVEE